MKTCKTCLKEKLITGFFKGKRYKGGYRSECKDCANKRTINNTRKKSLENKPICSRIGCSNKLGLYAKRICSNECRRLLGNERQNNIYKTERYRIKHREYMRRHLDISPEDYRIRNETN